MKYSKSLFYLGLILDAEKGDYNCSKKMTSIQDIFKYPDKISNAILNFSEEDALLSKEVRRFASRLSLGL
jgi:hypothetical protein